MNELQERYELSAAARRRSKVRAVEESTRFEASDPTHLLRSTRTVHPPESDCLSLWPHE